MFSDLFQILRKFQFKEFDLYVNENAPIYKSFYFRIIRALLLMDVNEKLINNCVLFFFFVSLRFLYSLTLHDIHTT